MKLLDVPQYRPRKAFFGDGHEFLLSLITKIWAKTARREGKRLAPAGAWHVRQRE